MRAQETAHFASPSPELTWKNHVVSTKFERRSMVDRKYLLMFITAAVCTVSLVAQTTSTTTTSTEKFVFPPAGLGSTETAQVNVVNTASNASSGTAASCTGTISFLNSAGTVIGTTTNFTVTAGQISSAKLAFASAGLTGVRGEIRGEVQWTQTRGTPCSVQASFETFDTATGATHIYLANSAGGGSGLGFGR